MASQDRINSLDFLRGVASFSVCWFHLTSFHYPTPDGPLYALVRRSGSYGWVGVEIFFVISGFVIPYSLYRARYQLRSYSTFIAKRLVRLDPPYLASIILLIVLAYLYSGYSGKPVAIEGEPVTFIRVILHLGYLNMFFGQSWLNPSYWTLAIEFQYYLLIGVLFPLVKSKSRLRRLLFLACFAAPAFFLRPQLIEGGVPYSRFIFQFGFLFVMGLLSFQRWIGLIQWREYLLLIILATLGALLTLGAIGTGAGIAGVVCLNVYNQKNLVATFFGNISYSLYLLHWPIGHLTLSIVGSKLLGAQSDVARIAVLLFSLGVCILSSYVLFRLVEKPAQQWSARLKYGTRDRRAHIEEVSGIAPAIPIESRIASSAGEK